MIRAESNISTATAAVSRIASFRADEVKDVATAAKDAQMALTLLRGAWYLVQADNTQPLTDEKVVKPVLQLSTKLLKSAGVDPSAEEVDDETFKSGVDKLSDSDVYEFREVLEEQAYKMIKQAENQLEINSEPLGAEIISVVARELRYDFGTMAVTLKGDGLPKLMYNPFFTLSLGAIGAAFVLAHEAYHLLYMHLLVDKHLAADQNFRLGEEVVINDRVLRHLQTSLPQVGGEETGVNPRKVHQSYRRAVKDVVANPASYDEFVHSDVACKNYLDQRPKEHNPKGGFACAHLNGEVQGGAGGDTGIDPDELEEIVEDALQATMQRAIAGNDDAKDSLLELYDEMPDNPMWGTLGVGRLRGETTSTRKTSFWEVLLQNALESRLEEGPRFAYDRKIGWWYEPLTLSGKEPHKVVSIYIDSSGSMTQAVIEKIASLVGRIEGADASWHTFDANVYEFEPGEPLPGGGGTSFHAVNQHVEEEHDEYPDCVLVLTDGHAPEIEPSRPQNWVWAVLSREAHGGNPWPRDKGMQTVEVDMATV